MTQLEVGTKVELRQHAKQQDREEFPDGGIRFYEGKVTDITYVGTQPRYTVRWDTSIVGGTTDVRPASHLKVIRETGARARHDELYSRPHGLRFRVEAQGEHLREALRQLYVPQECRRDHGTGYSFMLDFPGMDGTVAFDERRKVYDRLVTEFNRKARRHDKDGCC